MNFAYLAADPSAPPPPPPEAAEETLVLALETLDGARRLLLDGSNGWTHMPGSTGLEMPPYDVISAPIPGVHGTTLRDVRVEERPVFLPLFIGDGVGTIAEQKQRMAELRSIVDPLTGMFRIVGTTDQSNRELSVVYTGGLDGDDSVERFGLTWNKVGLTAVACEPFARARSDRSVEFSRAGTGSVFLGAVGGTDAIWPTALSSSLVIGEGMRVSVSSEVPVYPVLELVGPMTSFTSTMTSVSDDGSVLASGWSVDIPQGVPAGSTLRLVTDPRARSVRLDGALAAGRVARGSTLRPFYPGVNVLDVAAPGSTDATRVRLSWRELYRSLW